MDLEVQSIPQDQLRHVEGTVILHMVFAIRLDHELGREFLKSFKVFQNNVSSLRCLDCVLTLKLYFRRLPMQTCVLSVLPFCCRWLVFSVMKSRWENMFFSLNKSSLLKLFLRCFIFLLVTRVLLQVFDLLKGAVIKSYKDEHLQQGSKFLQDLLPGSCSVAQMILDTVKNRLA